MKFLKYAFEDFSSTMFEAPKRIPENITTIMTNAGKVKLKCVVSGEMDLISVFTGFTILLTSLISIALMLSWIALSVD